MRDIFLIEKQTVKETENGWGGRKMWIRDGGGGEGREGIAAANLSDVQRRALASPVGCADANDGLALIHI